MAKEIERKFLVKDNSFDKMATSFRHIKQAYLSAVPQATVRLRVSGNKAWITVKGKNDGAVRDEWEYEVPVADAEEMATRLAGGWAIDKTRYIVNYAGRCWEIDVFHGRHSGLILAEVELEDASENVDIPPFVGEEVTGNTKYYNSTLASV